jgi:hypothetical protein
MVTQSKAIPNKLTNRHCEISVISPKNVTKVVWYILVQSSSLLVSGHWLLASGSWSLATGHWLLVSGSASSKKPAASSKKPKIKPCFVDYLRYATL